ncbi:2Fe-2S iron-sulfur cluster binding domain-containing protein [Puniceicoccales bacterium CK1056]|uniref:2Fe-2S iron-sulfur cluster binding domain-containing protein n=1 Tax=Oceanipulchritudo coccoides TaxID=2706888 RepID=A0A6B2M0I1_9BACT|nr:2Fe-2S iron-sulfur cluster-binding protein [Oceanipulchritudo coccoides]NDV62418.1 2Fe-2S iron-sulfur cluster binding domain-containing protein [Oceanipulchritudo coccoides]
MSEENKQETVTIYIDGTAAEVPAGSNVVDAVESVGKEIPHYCYHPKLSVPGNCRMCLIEMGTPGRDRATGEPMLNDDGSPKIMWVPKPVIGCATKVSPGMHVRTESETVKACREGVMEFLLVNHPLDCPICDQAGECRLQEFATDYGRGYSRFVEQKNVKPKRTRLGPRVMLDDERCILCSRCIRFCEEIAEDPVLGFIDRGSFSTLTTFPGKQLENNYSLNTVDICPVGALTSTDFRFKMRVWFLKETPSIDTESSVGCNTVVGSREGTIYRITPRRNDNVNDTWMPDSGRELYKIVDSDERLNRYAINGRPAKAEEAIEEAAELLRTDKVAIVASGRLSLEEQYLLTRIRSELGDSVPTFLVGRTAEGDGKLLSADRNPNVRGALLTGLIDSYPEARLDKLNALVKDGSVKTILAVGEDITGCGIEAEALTDAKLLYMGVDHANCTQYAAVEIPLLTVFEKSGTLVNQQFRIQKFAQAVPGPAGVLHGLSTFTRLLNCLNRDVVIAPSPSAVWKEMQAVIPELSGMEFERIPSTGTLVDGARFDGIPFVEEKGLHFEPNNALAEA